MYLDFATERLPSEISSDVCIIGSGAAGIAIAREFLNTRVSVLILEGGGAEIEPASQDPYRGLVTGLPHRGIHCGRARAVGGTTKLWAGQALPLFDCDFAVRPWVPHSGWPIARNELEPYYRRAEEAMQIPNVSYDAKSWPNENLPPRSAGGPILTYFSQFAAVPDFATKYGEQLRRSSNMTLLTHANVVGLEAAGNASSVTSATIRSLSGKQASVRARYFVICCGGIDSARLLLASNSVEPRGIGNRHDMVGRFFQDHPVVVIPLKPSNPAQFAKWYNPCMKGGLRHVIKLVASPHFQRDREILHVGAEVYYPADERDPVNAAKELMGAVRNRQLRTRLLSNVETVARNPRRLAVAAMRRYLFRQSLTVMSTNHHLLMEAEQEPSPSSRVFLSEERDAVGMRRTVLDWNLTAAVSRSIRMFSEMIAEEWRKFGIASVDVDSARIDGREKGKNGGYVDFNHHIGTTRMGTDPKASVVNPDCRVHGYDNLYIGSSSVFPTGGFSNPTLTLLALSLRVADSIQKCRLSV